jgi:hypothetical protein
MTLDAMSTFHYHDTEIQKERRDTGRDHCGERTRTHDLAALTHDGKCWLHGHLLTSTALSTTGETGKYIFAVRDKTIRIAPDSRRGDHGATKHETLFHNADVDAAGEIQFHEGIIVDLNDHSVSYATYGSLSLTSVKRVIIDALESANATVGPSVRLRLGID